MESFPSVINHSLFPVSLLDEKALQRAPSTMTEQSINLCLGKERGAEPFLLLLHCCSKNVLKMEGWFGGHDSGNSIRSLTEPLINILGFLRIDKPENTTVSEVSNNRIPEEKLLWLRNIRPPEKSCNTCCESGLLL